MTKPGPKPTPTALKKLRGNPGRRPLPKDEPVLEPKAPRKPRGLKKKHFAAAKLYDQLARELQRAGISTALDGPAFRLMAEHYGLAMQAAQIIAVEGLMTVDERGLLRKHPMLQVLRDNSEMYRKYAAEFGGTPSSRTRLKAPPVPEEETLVDILYGEAGFLE